jgi:hypothetical protein
MIAPNRILYILSWVTPLLTWGESHVRLLTESYFTHYDFVRVSEYFTGKENTSGRVIVRSNETERDGLYLLLALDFPNKDSQPKPYKLVLQILDSESLDPVTYSFLLPDHAITQGELWLGLTGEDWPTPKKKIMAWHLAVQAKDDSILTNNQSFLWSHKK